MNGPPPTTSGRFLDFAKETFAALWELDAELRYAFVSDRHQEITGLKPGDVLGRTYAEIHEPRIDGDPAPFREHLAVLRRQRDFRGFTCAFRRRAGEVRWIRSNGHAVFDATGQFRGYRAVTEDATEEIQARRRAERTDATLLGALESLTEAFVLHDAEDRLVVCNSVYREIHGYNYDLLIPGSIFEERVRAAVQRGAIPAAEGNEEQWIQQRLGRHRNPCGIFEQQLDDGRWLQVSERRTSDGGCVGVHTDITETRRRHEEVRVSREQLRNLNERLQAVREDERALIAREIHDELGQAMTAMRMDLACIRTAVPVTDITAERFDALEGLVDGTLDTIRRIAMRLRPAMLDDLGLQAAIEWQVQEFAHRANCQCECDLRAHDLDPDRERDIAVFRILQEALTNVARHSEASRVWVSLWLSDAGELILEVIDDGKGIRPEDIDDTHSLGIIGMRERGGALGGQVFLECAPAGGTVARLCLPLDYSRNENRGSGREDSSPKYPGGIDDDPSADPVGGRVTE